ncbi:right-handed parallel beta-helix repeat-containing protein [Massilia luteola]|uniref:right-handed parallel beta-helix repeat-containing protein n=1 Tax=Massilia luteola TaxID=3081751 RepID=UPI002ACC1B05|nr:right-handed parallel beta-helix repeat-containing protein [Massilia sp. Gc5]
MASRQQYLVRGAFALAILSGAGGAAAATYYVAPGGNDAGAGTQAAPWASFAKAQAAAVAGDTVYFRGGAYVYHAGLNQCASMTDTVNVITLNKSGASGKAIRYWAYPGETPVFDFSQMKDNCRVKGFNVTGSWIHLKGLEVTGAPQQPGNLLNNESWGVWNSGSNNTFEALNTHHHMGPGMFIAKGSNNLVLNVDSHHNYDPYSKSGPGQNADGFGVHIGANQPGNVIRGCRAWANTDDGYDTINAYSPVLIENSWAWMMGYYPGTTTSVPAGNGNGFKLGGYGGVYVANAPQHTARFNVAFKNKAYGFYANHHPVANYFYNNTGVANHADFNMLGIDPSGAAISLGILRNNLAWQGTLVMNMGGADVANNSWNLASVSVTSADFQSASLDGWDAPRLPDGSLPVLPHLRLASGSDLLDKGVNVGLPYSGAAPDLGAFEGSAPVTLFTDVGANMKVTQSGLTLNRTTQQMSGTLSFTNRSTTTYDGVLMARLDTLSDGVVLSNRSGSQGGAPTLTVTSAHLTPGQTVTFPLVFANPAHVAIGYTPRLFAGQP